MSFKLQDNNDFTDKMVNEGKRLKPCPFCGWGTIVDNGIFYHYCECNDCHARTKKYKTKAEAIDAWNMRY